MQVFVFITTGIISIQPSVGFPVATRLRMIWKQKHCFRAKLPAAHNGSQRNKYTLSGSDFSYTYKRSGEEQSLVKQQKILLWPVALFQKHQIDLNRSFHYNETALNQLTDALAIFDPSYIEAPENAHLRITDDDYTIVNETPGNTPIRDEIIKEIQKP